MSTACQKNSSTTKKAKSPAGSSESSGLGSGTQIGEDNPSIDGCDGIARNSATRCYYKNIQRITMNGAGNTNQPGSTVESLSRVLWSSQNNLPGYDQESFRSDLEFNLRIKALKPYQNEKSVMNRFCSNNLSQFTRMKVFFMLRNSVKTITPYFSVEAKVDQYSKKVIVKNEVGLPTGANDKILEVIGIMTDHRCLLQNPPIGCGDGSYWGDIPLVVSSAHPDAPTACASFQIEYSTDSTYDLPK